MILPSRSQSDERPNIFKRQNQFPVSSTEPVYNLWLLNVQHFASKQDKKELSVLTFTSKLKFNLWVGSGCNRTLRFIHRCVSPPIMYQFLYRLKKTHGAPGLHMRQQLIENRASMNTPMQTYTVSLRMDKISMQQQENNSY